jgi:uncharacterized protein YbjT (DUF2867 family)
MKAILAGASGLVGTELLNLLLVDNRFSEVLVLVRHPLDRKHAKLTQKVINFDLLESYKDEVTGDIIYCCLGSTKKKTPDYNDYRKVDFSYPVELAGFASSNNINQYHLVSALGADSKSGVFYLRLKGETEDALRQRNIKSVHIYQPSQLTGNRIEYRPMERLVILLMQVINPLLVGNLRKYRSIPASTVAKAMINQTFKNRDGVFTHPSDEIRNIA